MYCNRSCLCVWGFGCVFVCGSVTTITRNCVHRSSPNWVYRCDRLQLIKFWPSCAPGKGVCSGAIFFGSTLLQPARAQCLRLSERFFHLLCFFTTVHCLLLSLYILCLLYHFLITGKSFTWLLGTQVKLLHLLIIRFIYYTTAFD